MGRMVIDAVKGMPTSAPSRTEHFRSRTRASTPFRVVESDSSDAESTDMSKSKPTETNSSDLGTSTKVPHLRTVIALDSLPLLPQLSKSPI